MTTALACVTEALQWNSSLPVLDWKNPLGHFGNAHSKE